MKTDAFVLIRKSGTHPIKYPVFLFSWNGRESLPAIRWKAGPWLSKRFLGKKRVKPQWVLNKRTCLLLPISAVIPGYLDTQWSLGFLQYGSWLGITTVFLWLWGNQVDEYRTHRTHWNPRNWDAYRSVWSVQTWANLVRTLTWHYEIAAAIYFTPWLPKCTMV